MLELRFLMLLFGSLICAQSTELHEQLSHTVRTGVRFWWRKAIFFLMRAIIPTWGITCMDIDFRERESGNWSFKSVRVTKGCEPWVSVRDVLCSRCARAQLYQCLTAAVLCWDLATRLSARQNLGWCIMAATAILSEQDSMGSRGVWGHWKR